jgi:hypothetical protein
MKNKNMLSQTIPIIQGSIAGQPTHKATTKLDNFLQKFWRYLIGDEEDKRKVPDPAAAIISQIEDQEVARIVKDLHYRTPQSLKAMRKACEQCFVLPDDCPYYDYNIFDVKKAIRRFIVQPNHTHKQIIEELQKINNELAYHLKESLE